METEESDHCREEAVAERLKQEPVNCMDCPPKNSRSGEVAVGKNVFSLKSAEK